MPTFRGEDPDARHLDQFFHSEEEIVGNLQNVMQIVGMYVHSLTSEIYDKFGIELRKAGIGTDYLEQMLKLDGKIKSVSYKEAKEILKYNPKFFEILPGNTETLSLLGEKELIKYFGGIVWVIHYPWMSIPFYQAKDENGEYAKCADLLFGIGEVAGCGERHVGYNDTLNALKLHAVETLLSTNGI